MKIDWSEVPEKYNWVGVDRNSQVWAYVNKPEVYGNGGYDPHIRGRRLNPSVVNGIDCVLVRYCWKELLFERPKTMIAEVIKYEYNGEIYDTFEEAEKAEKSTQKRNSVESVVDKVWYRGIDKEDIVDMIMENFA